MQTPIASFLDEAVSAAPLINKGVFAFVGSSGVRESRFSLLTLTS